MGEVGGLWWGVVELGGRGAGVAGVCGKSKVGYSFYLDTDSGAVSSVRDKNRHNIQGRQRWSLAVVWHHSHILINAIQRLHKLCSAPLWFYRVGKKPSVKADLAIFSHVLVRQVSARV